MRAPRRRRHRPGGQLGAARARRAIRLARGGARGLARRAAAHPEPGDVDGDEVRDEVDNCPDVRNGEPARHRRHDGAGRRLRRRRRRRRRARRRADNCRVDRQPRPGRRRRRRLRRRLPAGRRRRRRRRERRRQLRRRREPGPGRPRRRRQGRRLRPRPTTATRFDDRTTTARPSTTSSRPTSTATADRLPARRRRRRHRHRVRPRRVRDRVAPPPAAPAGGRDRPAAPARSPSASRAATGWPRSRPASSCGCAARRPARRRAELSLGRSDATRLQPRRAASWPRGSARLARRGTTYAFVRFTQRRPKRRSSRRGARATLTAAEVDAEPGTGTRGPTEASAASLTAPAHEPVAHKPHAPWRRVARRLGAEQVSFGGEQVHAGSSRVAAGGCLVRGRRRCCWRRRWRARRAVGRAADAAGAGRRSAPPRGPFARGAAADGRRHLPGDARRTSQLVGELDSRCPATSRRARSPTSRSTRATRT